MSVYRVAGAEAASTCGRRAMAAPRPTTVAATVTSARLTPWQLARLARQADFRGTARSARPPWRRHTAAAPSKTR